MITSVCVCNGKSQWIIRQYKVADGSKYGFLAKYMLGGVKYRSLSILANRMAGRQVYFSVFKLELFTSGGIFKEQGLVIKGCTSIFTDTNIHTSDI